MKAFAKHFIPLEKIAEGGMAEIYLARQIGAGNFSKVVILKKVFSKYAQNTEFKEMFQSEAALCSLMHHPNVVNVFSSGLEEGHLYMSMEYIPGFSLRQLIKKTRNSGKSLATPMLLHIVKSVAQGLDYIHNLKHPETRDELNLVHRDISPQNIMIDFHGQIKVIDFGVAKSDADLNQTQNGVIKGNFSYMSPEQARAEKVSSKSDVFSLGVVFYEALTGQRPFTGKTPVQLLKAIDSCIYKKIPEIKANSNLKVVKLIDEMMTYDVKARINAKDIIERADDILQKNYPKFSAAEFCKAIENNFKQEAIADQEKVSSLLQQSSKAAVNAADDLNISSMGINDLKLKKAKKEDTKSTASKSAVSQLASTSHWRNDSQIVATKIKNLRSQQRKQKVWKVVKKAVSLCILCVGAYYAYLHAPVDIKNKVSKVLNEQIQFIERKIASEN